MDGRPIDCSDEALRALTNEFQGMAKERQRMEFWHGVLIRSERSVAAATRSVVEAANDHRDALQKASNSANQYARRLVWATWALFAATVVFALLALAEYIQILTKVG